MKDQTIASSNKLCLGHYKDEFYKYSLRPFLKRSVFTIHYLGVRTFYVPLWTLWPVSPVDCFTFCLFIQCRYCVRSLHSNRSY